MTHDEMIAVIAAHRDEKKIQSKRHGFNGPWLDDPAPFWNFANYDYRVKLEPREFWLNVYPLETGGVSIYGYHSPEIAEKAGNARIARIHVREVIE